MGKPSDWTQLSAVLIWIVSGGGAGALAYILWNELESWFPNIDGLPSKAKRYITTAITVIFGLAAFGIQIAMQYRPVPVSWIDGAEQAFSVIALALIAALTIHGARHLN